MALSVGLVGLFFLCLRGTVLETWVTIPGVFFCLRVVGMETGRCGLVSSADSDSEELVDEDEGVSLASTGMLVGLP